MHIYHANIIGRSILSELSPFCETYFDEKEQKEKAYCRIAGSIRRQKEEVKDIEVVCIPKKSVFNEKNLFGEVISSRTIIHPEFERIIKGYGTIIKGQFTGKYMQLETKHMIEQTQHVIKMDLFMPRLEDFWRQFAIRTGSADFAQRHIASQWVKNGWCAIDGILYLQKDCLPVFNSDGSGRRVGWKLRDPDADHKKPPVWKSEEEFFNWLDTSWKQFGDPRQRNL